MDNETPLRDYLEQREEAIVKERARLHHELEEVRAARAAIETRERHSKRNSPSPKLTIKDMVRTVLEVHSGGGSSDQIISWIKDSFDTEVARTSLSPQLSRLKADEEVFLDEDDGIWQLAPRNQRRNESWSNEVSGSAGRRFPSDLHAQNRLKWK